MNLMQVAEGLISYCSVQLAHLDLVVVYHAYYVGRTGI